MTSDAGALLRAATDRAIGLVERFAVCFTDDRTAELIEHEVRTLVGQRVLAIVLGNEGLVDHDQLRHDPTLAVLADKLAARCAAGRQVETQPVEVGWARENGLPAAVATARKAVVAANAPAYPPHSERRPYPRRRATAYRPHPMRRLHETVAQS